MVRGGLGSLLCPFCPSAGGHPQQDLRRRFESDPVRLLLTAVFGRRRRGRESLDLRFAPGPRAPWAQVRGRWDREFPVLEIWQEGLRFQKRHRKSSQSHILGILDEHVGFWKISSCMEALHGHTSHHSLLCVRNHVVPHRVSCIKNYFDDVDGPCRNFSTPHQAYCTYPTVSCQVSRTHPWSGPCTMPPTGSTRSPGAANGWPQAVETKKWGSTTPRRTEPGSRWHRAGHKDIRSEAGCFSEFWDKFFVDIECWK